MATKKGKYHQDGVAPETFKFDREADAAAQVEYQKAHPLSVLNTTEGKPVNTAERQRARIKAQMNSKKRGY
jgi:hypothetical protein